MNSHAGQLEVSIEQAVSARLAKLAAWPVDTSRLERAIKAKLPPANPYRRKWLASLSAIAASLIVLVSVALVLFHTDRAHASPVALAQIHQDMVAGKIPTLRTNSIDDANRAIAAMAGDVPSFPTPPESHQMICCMREIGNKKVACLLLDDGGIPVTIAVSQANGIRCPDSPTVTRNGVVYRIHKVGELTMVMCERQNRWICIIGQTSQERLIALADGLKF